MEDSSKRRLIRVPIVHSQEDMGRLRDAVRRHHVERHGEQRWDEHVRSVESFWREIRRGITGLDIDPVRLRLYQDGLPVCGKELAIITDLANAGSENHRLLAELIGRGASVEGTEAPELLLREYEMALKMLGNPHSEVTPEAKREFDRLGRDLLQRRDRYIAERIDRTLRTGEVGLVFLGMLHNLDPYLPPGIVVERFDVSGLPGVVPGH